MKYLIASKIWTTFDVLVFIVAATVSTSSYFAGDYWLTTVIKIVGVILTGFTLSELLKFIILWYWKLFVEYDKSNTNPPIDCQAEQLGNEMHCIRCKLRWDLNDSNPPKCLPEYSRSKAFANYINASLFTRLRCIWSKQQTYVNTDRHISNTKFFEGCEINGQVYQVVR